MSICICGKGIEQPPRGRKKKFCCTRCRNAVNNRRRARAKKYPTLLDATIDALRNGPRSAVQIELHLAEVGYAPVGVNYSLAVLKREGRIIHLRRGSRYVTGLYGLPKDNQP